MTQRGSAYLWMLGTVVSFTSMAVAGRALHLDLTPFDIMLFRSLVGLVVVTAVAAATGRLPEITTARMDLHLMRNLAHFTGQNLWFYAVGVIPLAQVFALEFLNPIWAILLTPLILGEAIRKTGLLAAALGFAGILIVTQPGTAPLSPGLVAAAFCGIGFALSALFTRKLTRHASLTCILFWLTALQSVFGILCTLVIGGPHLPPLSAVPWLVLIALAGLAAHFCLTTALSRAPASDVLPVDFLRLPLIALIGAAFYDEPLALTVAVGGALIIAGNLINLRETAVAEK